MKIKTSQNQQQAVCKKEATDLINCVDQSPYDQDQCLSLFEAWRQCVHKAVCKKKATDLINCVDQSPYDQDQCLSLFEAWHQCVDMKVKNSVNAHTREAVSNTNTIPGKKQI